MLCINKTYNTAHFRALQDNKPRFIPLTVNSKKCPTDFGNKLNYSSLL